jgi:uncharacterized protein (TIGR03086 family)
MSDVRGVFERASRQLTATVAAVGTTAWDSPTPCAVSVRELVEHVLAGNEFAVRLLAGATADEARAGIDGIRLGSDPEAQVSASCAAQTRAFATADRTRPLHHPSGDIDFDTFVWFRLGELVVHCWDVAAGADLDRRLDPETVQALLGMVAGATEQMRALGGYGSGPSARLPADASAQERLLDAFGRRT